MLAGQARASGPGLASATWAISMLAWTLAGLDPGDTGAAGSRPRRTAAPARSVSRLPRGRGAAAGRKPSPDDDQGEQRQEETAEDKLPESRTSRSWLTPLVSRMSLIAAPRSSRPPRAFLPCHRPAVCDRRSSSARSSNVLALSTIALRGDRPGSGCRRHRRTRARPLAARSSRSIASSQPLAAQRQPAQVEEGVVPGRDRWSTTRRHHRLGLVQGALPSRTSARAVLSGPRLRGSRAPARDSSARRSVRAQAIRSRAK